MDSNSYAETDSKPGDDSDEKDNVKIIERLALMKSKRGNWEDHWEECMTYIVPRKEDIITTTIPGEKRGNELYDSTAIMANTLLAGALHSMLTNPATRFFDLIMGDAALDDIDEVREWLQDTADKMYNVFNNSNFQTEIHEVYIDLGSIGTACMYMGEHDESVVHFSARPMKEIFIEENNLGLIDTVYRCFQWSPKQVIQEFGEDKVPEYVREQYKKGNEEKWEIVHCVEPEALTGGFHDFKSKYVLIDKKLTLSKMGFKEFPYAVPRWTKTSGEIYGRGPGMDMLSDIKMVNAMMFTTIKGAQMTVNPPLMVSDDGVIGRVRLTPGGLTVVRPGEPPIRPLIVDARIDFGYQCVEDVRKRIRSGFYVDQLQLNEGPQMTATEVNQRTEEKLRLMGPVLGRQHFEFLRPVIERVFGIMMRRGLVKPAPQQISGKKFDVKYSSLVARAQRMVDGDNLTRAVNVMAPFVQMDPGIMDNLDADKTLRYTMEIYGVPQKLLRNEREIKDVRAQRAQAQQKAMQQQQQLHQADIVQKAGPTAVQAQQLAQKPGA